MSTVKRLRAIQTETLTINAQLQTLNASLKNHPDKYVMVYGRSPEESREAYNRWIRVTKQATKERARLLAKQAELSAERESVLAHLNESPVPVTTLGGIINALVALEARFGNDDVEDIHEALTRFVDQLEDDEQRTKALMTVAAAQ